MLTSQLSILRATVASDAMPEKKCADIYRPGKLINCATFGEAFKRPHLQRYLSRKLEDEGGTLTMFSTLIDLLYLGVQ